MNTTLAAAAGGLGSYLLVLFVDRMESVIQLSNGLLAGLVGITAACNTTKPWSSIVIGFISGILQTCGSKFLKKIKIDDPLDAFSIHGICGFWGVIASGLFNSTEGLFYGETKVFIGCLIGAFVITGWTVIWALIIFLPMKQMKIFRVAK